MGFARPSSSREARNPLRVPTTIEEKEGFEPSELSLYSFQDCRLRPLGHFSGLTNLGTYALGDALVNGDRGRP